MFIMARNNPRLPTQKYHVAKVFEGCVRISNIPFSPFSTSVLMRRSTLDAFKSLGITLKRA
jgi:hypothetical protein